MPSPSYSNPLLPILLGGLLLSINVGHTLLTELSAKTTGSLPFRESSAVLTSELCKLLLSFCLFLKIFLARKSTKYDPALVLTPRTGLKMAVPGLLYTVSNMLSYTATGQVGSTNYQLFSNMKIIITAIMFRVVMKKPLKLIQWGCILLLTIGFMTATAQCKHTQVSSDADPARLITGVITIVILSVASALAGVYFELSLKTAPEHLLLQNLCMYAWSSIFCVLKYNLESSSSSFFDGFSPIVWGAIATDAIYGQVISLVLYYTDNMFKIFANSSSTLVSAWLEYLATGTSVGGTTWVSGFIVGFSTIGYYADHEFLLRDDTGFFASKSKRGPEDVPLHRGEESWLLNETAAATATATGARSRPVKSDRSLNEDSANVV